MGRKKLEETTYLTSRIKTATKDKLKGNKFKFNQEINTFLDKKAKQIKNEDSN